jgi:ubiquinone/menaquinone biosynthesis C-methylase UbiE
VNYTKEFVAKVNEVWHDIEAEAYQRNHPEIFVDEIRQWRRITRHLASFNACKIRLLDVGTGTGFVPIQLKEFLKSSDYLVCSDLSSKMLQVCRRNLIREGLACQIEFIKLDDKGVIYNGEPFDIITLNSVLHHVLDYESMLHQLDKLLKRGGYLVIAHEPNRRYVNHKFLNANYRILSRFIRKLTQNLGVRINIKDRVVKTLESLNCLGFARSAKSLLRTVGIKQTHPLQDVTPPGNSENLLARVNDRLLGLRVLSKPFASLSEVYRITDVHVPTDGTTNSGFEPMEIPATILPHYDIEYFETYRHLSWLSSRNWWTKAYDSILSKIFPRDGETFVLVMKKCIKPPSAGTLTSSKKGDGRRADERDFGFA